MRTDLKLSRWHWLWPLAVAGTIVWASDHGRVAVPRFTTWVPDFDKIAHFSVYGLLATLLVRVMPTRRGPWVAIVVVSLFGVSDEWHQSYTPGRSSDVMDWLADTVGAALAVAMYCGWSWYRRALEARWQRRTPLVAPEAPPKPALVPEV